ncbi:MAG TPA: VOC family protein [Chloroflexota bacterium]
MTNTFEIVFDCADPTRIGVFWSTVLGYQEDLVPEGYASWEEFDREKGIEPNIGWGCFDPAGNKPALFFQRVPEGKTVKNRLHLDLRVGDVRAETERLQSLGARVLQEVESESGGWVVMADPEGNEFCVAPLDE